MPLALATPHRLRQPLVRRSLWLAVATLVIGAGCAKNDNVADVHRGIPPDAVVETEKSVEPNAKVHIAAGDLAVTQNQLDKAIPQYEAALKLEPNNDDALFKLATLQTHSRNFDAAVALWERYAHATHDSAIGFSNLGRCHELAGHWREAEVAYLEAIKRDAKSNLARVNYGILLAKRDRVDEAERQLSAVLPPAQVQYNLGSVLELRRDYASARTRYEKSLEIDPTLTAATQRLSMLRELTKAE